MLILLELFYTTGGLIVLLVASLLKKENFNYGYIVAIIISCGIWLTTGDIIYGKILIEILTISLLIIFSQNEIFKESGLLILFSLCGLLFLLSCEDLISFYLAIELYSLSVYILATNGNSQGSTDERSISGGLKYFLLGALQSCILILGCSLIYASTGELSFEPLSRYTPMEFNSVFLSPFLFRVGVGILVAFILFKIGSAPFHFWVADVYDNIPLFVNTYLIIIPKLVLIFVLVRFCILFPFIQPFILFASILSLIIGSLLGLVQKRTRRLLAFSSIGHIGYLLMPLSLNNSIYFADFSVESLTSIWLYLIFYSVMTFNFFIIFISAIKPLNFDNSYLDSFVGLSKANPFLAASLAITLLSMAGIPPLAGFVTKLSIYYTVIDSGLYSLALLGLLCSVISGFYYLKPIKISYFNLPVSNHNIVPKPLNLLNSLFISFFTCILLLFIFNPDLLYIYLQLFSYHILL